MCWTSWVPEGAPLVKLAIVAAFPLPVELGCKINFTRLFAERSIVWLPQADPGGGPFLRFFESELLDQLKRVPTAALVLSPTGAHAQLDSVVEHAQELHPATFIEFRRLHPMDVDEVRRALIRHFGHPSRDPEISQDTLRRALGHGTVVCVSSRTKGSFREALQHTVVRSKQWELEELRHERGERRAMVATLLRRSPSCSRLLYASSGLGDLSPSVAARYAGRLDCAPRVVDVLQSFFRFLLHQQKALEIDETRKIQEALLPASMPVVPGCGFSTFWQPASEVAGDYLDVFCLDSGVVALVVADVVGKGLPAAMLVSKVQGVVRTMALQGVGPARLCTRANRELWNPELQRKHVTLFYAEFHPGTGRLQYTNAGHHHPILRRANGTWFQLEKGGRPLGALPDSSYEEEEVLLQRGDRLLLFSDGISEAVGADDTPFGSERLVELLQDAHKREAEDLKNHVVSAVANHCGGDFEDDATLLVLAFDPAERAAAP